MISPTGLWIRNDAMGEGHYGASRGNGKTHKGTDFEVNLTGKIYQPLSGVITRRVQVYGNDPRWVGCEIQARRARVHLYYFQVYDFLIGKRVEIGEIIGDPQDISLKYNHKMKPHVHLEIKDCDPMFFMETF
jgi:hypothetical protein